MWGSRLGLFQTLLFVVVLLMAVCHHTYLHGGPCWVSVCSR